MSYITLFSVTLSLSLYLYLWMGVIFVESESNINHNRVCVCVSLSLFMSKRNKSLSARLSMPHIWPHTSTHTCQGAHEKKKTNKIQLVLHAFGVEFISAVPSTKRFNFHLLHTARTDTHRIFMLAAMDIAHESTGTSADIGIPDNALLGYIVRAQTSNTIRCWAKRAVLIW